jgi:hypothetical protein
MSVSFRHRNRNRIYLLDDRTDLKDWVDHDHFGDEILLNLGWLF